jgi:putative transposase
VCARGRVLLSPHIAVSPDAYRRPGDREHGRFAGLSSRPHRHPRHPSPSDLGRSGRRPQPGTASSGSTVGAALGSAYIRRNRRSGFARRANEMWHIDTTVIRLLGGTRTCLHAVIDNLSRRILAWRVVDTFAPVNSVTVLLEASRAAAPSDTTRVVLADAGVENVNARVDVLIQSGVLRRLLAFAELEFSNSTIEAWWRSLQHQWLFLHPLDSITTVRRLAAFYVDEHNRVRLHSAFRGQTPDEMYFGTGDAILTTCVRRRPPPAGHGRKQIDQRRARHARRSTQPRDNEAHRHAAHRDPIRTRASGGGAGMTGPHVHASRLATVSGIRVTAGDGAGYCIIDGNSRATVQNVREDSSGGTPGGHDLHQTGPRCARWRRLAACGPSNGMAASLVVASRKLSELPGGYCRLCLFLCPLRLELAVIRY